MPRRQSVAHHACELCRQRKRKCDGDGTSPCKACHEAGADCVYLAPSRVSKADLREELARLQSINSDNSALLDAISSHKTSPAQLNNILQRLSDGQPRAEVAELLTQSPGSREEASTGGSSTSVPTSASPMSPDTLLSSTEDISRSSLLQESTSPSKPVPSQQHVQSNLEFYRSQLPQLLDVILARDCLSFCPILREDFIHDFAAGSGQNCSAALIDALLALATLLAREKIVALAAPYPEGELQEDLGNAFAQEAIAALYSEEGLPQNVADIQALGILALYCLGCGKMNDGLGFASDFGAAIAEQWRIRQSDPNFAHRQTYATIYCAAVSFNRLLFLIQDYHKTLDGLAIKVGLERSPLHESGSIDSTISSTNLSGSIIDDAFFEKDLSLLPNSPKVVAAKVFEFTEWVYKARFTVQKSFDQAVKLYQNGLQWYESFFAYTSSCTNETPLVLFAQYVFTSRLWYFFHGLSFLTGCTSTYYHFGVMCLLTPYVLESVAVASDGTLPIMVCKQAAGSIGELVQHYSKLYNDGQLLDFMPFFKAAAVAFLEICEAKIPA